MIFNFNGNPVQFQGNTNENPFENKLTFQWNASWNFNEIPKSIENQVEIQKKFQWNTNENPLEIQLKFEWNTKENYLKSSWNWRDKISDGKFIWIHQKFS